MLSFAFGSELVLDPLVFTVYCFEVDWAPFFNALV